MPVPPPSAEAFAAAVERMVAHSERDTVVVVKLGGSAMEDPAATDACLRSVATLNRFAIEVVLVHGGGKPIDRAMADAGLTPKKVAGRRYTDEATLEIVVRVLREINAKIVNDLLALGIRPVGLADSQGLLPLSGERLALSGSGGHSIDLGRVGRVTGVDGDAISSYFGSRGAPGMVPVIPSLAKDASGGWLNVNADTVASAVAGEFPADKAIFLTDTPGVLRDRANPDSLIPSLSEREARELIAAGVIDGGMVPKVEACFEALDAGAKSALILDGRVPYSLLDVFLRDTFRGTAISR